MVRKSSDTLRAVLAENIRTFRKEKGFSQEQLAELCGLHRTYIGSVERHERNVTLSTLEVLASTFSVTVPGLLTQHDSPSNSERTGEDWGSISEEEIAEMIEALRRLTPVQRRWVKSAVHAFGAACQFERAPDSDVVTDAVLASLGDRLLSHHAGSRQALSKDRFEFKFETALNAAGIPAQLVKSRTNRGHDISIRGVPVSLKTEAAASIKDGYIHVSKWMELGRGEWKLPLLRDLFLEHLQSYDRVFTLRRLKDDGAKIRYELVEIPKELLLEAKDCVLEACAGSKQNPQPGYGHVKDEEGRLKYSLYFDGGTERKLQIKHLRKDLCKVHATWTFGSTPS
jgi:transcriptional regulator with XRE-family HTH domain